MRATATSVMLIDRAVCARGVESFRFEKPDGYSFEPGQHMMLGLETADGHQDKPFTHAEAPHEPYLEIATRMTGSSFKNALAGLRPGDAVSVTGPLGHAVLPVGATRAAFLVGGVGITPARSALRDALHRGTGLEAVLFYGNQDETCIPFREELEADAASDPKVTIVHVLFDPPSGWPGESGFITAEIVRRYLDPSDGWHFVVAGPPAMVDAMGLVLAELGVDDSRATLGRFTGYE